MAKRKRLPGSVRDIAEQADVSPTTAARAIRSRRGIPETHRTLSFSVTVAEADFIDRVAQEAGCSRSSLLRTLVRSALAE